MRLAAQRQVQVSKSSFGSASRGESSPSRIAQLQPCKGYLSLRFAAGRMDSSEVSTTELSNHCAARIIQHLGDIGHHLERLLLLL
jgi:hypothetical protein